MSCYSVLDIFYEDELSPVLHVQVGVVLKCWRVPLA